MTAMAAKKKSAPRTAKSAKPAKSTGARQALAKRPVAPAGGKKSPPQDAVARHDRARQIVRLLGREYPDAECALHHNNAFELLVATILSAQCTDERVNLVTPPLFKKYPTPAAFAAAPLEAIEKAIQSTGFFRNKAKSIKAASQAIVDDHDGDVPQELDAMVRLAGVGRKTANVVLGVAYGKASGVVVDTHVGRLSRRLGLTANDDPVKVEADLMAILPQNEWIDFSHRLIHHGRRVCQARKPTCDACVLNEVCPKIGVA
jgi:endonuclease-3